MMSAKACITALRRRPPKKRPAIDADALLLINDRGIEGACPSGGAPQLALLPADNNRQVCDIADKGLCS